MKERASWPMKAHEVRAILEGRKTQARMVVKPQPIRVDGGIPFGDAPAWAKAEPGSAMMRCPYGQRGYRLWVRESARCISRGSNGLSGELQKPVVCVEYAAGGTECFDSFGDWFPADGLKKGTSKPRWTPSIHMPRWASRITLEIVSVRVERLQDISVAGAIAEGCPGGDHGDRYAALEQYRALWESIHGQESWDANPLVWVLEFKRVTA